MSCVPHSALIIVLFLNKLLFIYFFIYLLLYILCVCPGRPRALPKDHCYDRSEETSSLGETSQTGSEEKVEIDGESEEIPDCEYKSCTWIMTTYENNISVFTHPVLCRILTEWKNDPGVTILYRIMTHTVSFP